MAGWISPSTKMRWCDVDSLAEISARIVSAGTGVEARVLAMAGAEEALFANKLSERLALRDESRAT